VPPSNHFEKLSGKLKGYHSIRVNQKWRHDAAGHAALTADGWRRTRDSDRQ
jgi:plasmid maintenance system killer protein